MRLSLVGERYGRLVVIERVDVTDKGISSWKCICDCGKETIVRHGNLRNGHTTSCGCKALENPILQKGRMVSDETRKKIGDVTRGKTGKRKGSKHKQETIEVLRAKASGKKMVLETKIKLSKSISGDRSCKWRGGINPINDTIRKSVYYSEWRKSAFERDDYTCQACHIKGGILNAHHILPFSKYPELRFELSNGITLCKKCHGLEHSNPYNSDD